MSADIFEVPLVQRAWEPNSALPPTWCVVECNHGTGCRETWTVDTADFTPPLTAQQVERLLTPLLLDHEQRRHEAASDA